MTASSALKESIGLMLQLHGLIRAGQGESPDAEAIRDRLDDFWGELQPDEIGLLRSVSTDLNALADGPRFVTMSGEAFERWEAELYAELVQRKNYQASLELLRRPPDQFDAGTIRRLTANCWRSIGFPNVATAFFDESSHHGMPAGASVLRGISPHANGAERDSFDKIRPVADDASETVWIEMLLKPRAG